MKSLPSTGKATSERAHSLTKLVRKFKIFMLSEDMTYSDKVAVLTFIVGSYFRILHQYKIDEELYKKAQEELFTTVSAMNDENSIDSAFQLTLYYLELLTKSLRKWL